MSGRRVVALDLGDAGDRRSDDSFQRDLDRLFPDECIDDANSADSSQPASADQPGADPGCIARAAPAGRAATPAPGAAGGPAAPSLASGSSEGSDSAPSVAFKVGRSAGTQRKPRKRRNQVRAAPCTQSVGASELFSAAKLP
jgi:hypothetical protein